MAHVLIVAAFQLRYPMLLLILMKANDAAPHGVAGAAAGNSSQQRAFLTKPSLA